MNPGTILLLFVFVYFAGLLIISYFTSRNSDNQSFFIGNKKSKWWLVAFGMIGTSLSGVTFISVPGTVGKMTGSEYIFGGFEYYMMVIGFFIGYFIVAAILLPLYYKMNLTSIYTYLGKRFNVEAHKIGSIFFIVSRAIGATARLYLVVNVLQIFLLEGLGVPFWVTAMVLLLMVLLYTFEGGVKTIVITDTLQTSFMIISLIACIVYILSNLNLSFGEAYTILGEKNYTHFINFDPNSKTFFLKTILGGIFQMVQLWVNLPAKDKMSKPKYQAISNSEMKKVDLGENGIIEIIAGKFEEYNGPAFTFTPINLMNAKLKSGGKANFNFPANFNTAALVIEGSITINGEEKAPTNNFVLFKNEGESFTVEATEDSVILIISGEPINEQIFPHGPFVMNSREEIMQAFEDFNTGKFGYLED